MRRWLQLGVLLFLCLAALGQQRMARVELEDGRVVEGVVLAMDIGGMRLQVGSQEVAIDARTIRSCTFSSGHGEATGEATGEAGAATEIEAPESPVPSGGHESEPAGDSGAAVVPPPKPVASRKRTRALAEAGDDRRSPGSRRLAAVGSAFPWLAPEHPLQWISLGVTLFALLSLCVHLSARMALSENVVFSRCCGLAAWLLVSTLAQAAMVPSGAPVVVASVVSVAVCYGLFRWLFGLGRWTGTMAVGLLAACVAIGFCLLKLCDALLRSIGIDSLA